MKKKVSQDKKISPTLIFMDSFEKKIRKLNSCVIIKRPKSTFFMILNQDDLKINPLEVTFHNKILITAIYNLPKTFKWEVGI